MDGNPLKYSGPVSVATIHARCSDRASWFVGRVGEDGLVYSPVWFPTQDEARTYANRLTDVVTVVGQAKLQDHKAHCNG